MFQKYNSQFKKIQLPIQVALIPQHIYYYICYAGATSVLLYFFCNGKTIRVIPGTGFKSHTEPTSKIV